MDTYTDMINDPFGITMDDAKYEKTISASLFDISDFHRSYLIRDLDIITSSVNVNEKMSIRIIYYTNKNYKHISSLCFILNKYLFDFDIICYTNKNISIEPSINHFVKLYNTFAIDEFIVTNQTDRDCTIFIYDVNSKEDLNIFEANDDLLQSRIMLNNTNKVHLLNSISTQYVSTDTKTLMCVFNIEFLKNVDYIDFYGEFVNFPWVDSSDNEIFYKVNIGVFKNEQKLQVDRGEDTKVVKRLENIYKKWLYLNRIIRHIIPSDGYARDAYRTLTSDEYTCNIYYDKLLEFNKLSAFKNLYIRLNKISTSIDDRNINDVLKDVDTHTDFFPNIYMPDIERNVNEERKMSKLYVDDTNELLFSATTLKDVIISNNCVYISDKNHDIREIITDSDLMYFKNSMNDSKYNTYRNIISLGGIILIDDKNQRQYIVHYKLSYLIHKLLYIVNNTDLNVYTPSTRSPGSKSTKPLKPAKEITLDYANNINKYIDLQIGVLHTAIKNYINKSLETSETKYVKPTDIFKIIKYVFGVLVFDPVNNLIYKTTHINQMNIYFDTLSSRITNIPPHTVVKTIENMFLMFRNTTHNSFSRFKYIMRIVYICVYPLLQTINQSILNKHYSITLPENKHDTQIETPEETQKYVFQDISEPNGDEIDIFSREEYSTRYIDEDIESNIRELILKSCVQLNDTLFGNTPQFIWLDVMNIYKMKETYDKFDEIIATSFVYNHIAKLLNVTLLKSELIVNKHTCTLFTPTILIEQQYKQLLVVDTAKNVIYRIDNHKVYDLSTDNKHLIVQTNDNFKDVEITDTYNQTQYVPCYPLTIRNKIAEFKTYMCIVRHADDKDELLYYKRPFIITGLKGFRRITQIGVYDYAENYIIDSQLTNKKNVIEGQQLGSIMSETNIYSYLFSSNQEYNDYFDNCVRVVLTTIASYMYDKMSDTQNANQNTTFELFEVSLMFDGLLNPWIRNVTNVIDYHITENVQNTLLPYLFDYVHTGKLNSEYYDKLLFGSEDHIATKIKLDTKYTIVDEMYLYVKTSDEQFANCKQMVDHHTIDIDIQDDEETQEQIIANRYFSLIDYILQQNVSIVDSDDPFVTVQHDLLQHNGIDDDEFRRHVSGATANITLDKFKEKMSI